MDLTELSCEAPAHVLLVGSDRSFCEVLLLALEELAIRAERCEDLAKACRRVDGDSPVQLVLLDLSARPGTTDWSAVYRLRDAARARGLPMVVMTTFDGELDPVLDMDVQGLLFKPFPLQSLFAAVEPFIPVARSFSRT